MGLLVEIQKLKQQGKSLEEVIEEISSKYPSVSPIIVASIYYAITV